MRKLWCLVFMVVFVMPGLSSASSNSNVLGIGCPDEVPSFDIPAADYIMENFFEEDHFTHINNTDIVFSSDQFLGIMVLLSIYNTTKNVDYLSYAENVWNYSNDTFHDESAGLYSYDNCSDEKYVLDNSYALLANLELYAATNDSKYLHRSENISKKIVSMQMVNGLFPASSQNSDVDIKTQAVTSFALLKYGNDSYKQIALSVLNATIEVYLDDGYNQSGRYYAIDNAMMTFATAEAYEITGIESFKNVSEKTAMFLYNMSIAFFGTFIGVAPFVEKNETGFFVPDYNTTVLDQLWSYVALMKTADITGNSSYEEKALMISGAILLFWDFNNGGFIDSLNNVNKTFEPNALTVIIFETPVNISLEDFYSEVSVVLPKSIYASSANPSVSSSCYAVSNFTINANSNMTDKMLFNALSKISFCNVSYGDAFCFKEKEEMNLYFDSITGKYFFLSTNLTKGINSFQSWVHLPVYFFNMSITPDAIVVNFGSYEPVFVNYTELFLESNVTVTGVSVNGKSIDYSNYSVETHDDYLKIFINETIEYNKTCFVINYTDDEKPEIENIRFLSSGKEIHEITPGIDVSVECDVNDNNVINNVTLFYNSGNGWKNVSMHNPSGTSSGTYEVYLGAFDRDVEVYINVTDLSGNTCQSQTYILKTEKEQPPNHLIFYVFLMMILIGAVIVLILRKVFK
ncbi:MAG: glycoside hydrolase family 76 protein [Candidatus Thermoplasmatota archaeon]|nr:glycoside hydrolase family 76 protein [Candidatus Thermoplasmatota archaeon]